MSTAEWVKLLSIPVFTGVVGWLINWTGLIMLFNPVEFHGFRVKGLSELSTLLRRKVQEIPGIMQGGIGWQGIVPARAAKMGSISVDKAISKLGTPAEFYEQLEPHKMAEHIVSMFQREPTSGSCPNWHAPAAAMWTGSRPTSTTCSGSDPGDRHPRRAAAPLAAP